MAGKVWIANSMLGRGHCPKWRLSDMSENCVRVMGELSERLAAGLMLNLQMPLHSIIVRRDDQSTFLPSP